AAAMKIEGPGRAVSHEDKRIATCAVVAFEYIPQRAAACVGRGGEVQRTTGGRQAREDRVDARSLVGEVCHLGRALDRVGAGEPHAGPIGYLDRRPVVSMRIDRGERLDE